MAEQPSESTLKLEARLALVSEMLDKAIEVLRDTMCDIRNEPGETDVRSDGGAGDADERPSAPGSD